jgi:hypothetical protein
MPGKTRKASKDRKGPSESATAFPEGTIKRGNDTHDWLVKKGATGISRWVPINSASLNGFSRLTVDYAAKHLGKPITIYCSEYKDAWPKKNDWVKKPDSTYIIMNFTPSGDAIKEKTNLKGWLKTQKPSIKRSTHFYLDGPLYMCPTSKCDDYLIDRLQVDSLGGQILSPNLMNTVAYVKV